MNIEIGEYIRTFNGEIAKIIGTSIEFDTKVYTTDQYIQSSRDFYVFENDCGITKHSKNIIDLIEVGDYVNGNKAHSVDYSTSTQTGEKYLVIDKIYQSVKYFYEKDIKTIVTKEMMKSVEYRVE